MKDKEKPKNLHVVQPPISFILISPRAVMVTRHTDRLFVAHAYESKSKQKYLIWREQIECRLVDSWLQNRMYILAGFDVAMCSEAILPSILITQSVSSFCGRPSSNPSHRPALWKHSKTVIKYWNTRTGLSDKNAVLTVSGGDKWMLVGWAIDWLTV